MLVIAAILSDSTVCPFDKCLKMRSTKILFVCSEVTLGGYSVIEISKEKTIDQLCL